MSWLRRLPLPLALALLLSPVGVPVSQARTQQVPASWMVYASRVSRVLQARLADNQDAGATRLHAFLDARADAPNAEPPAPVLRLWFDKQGAISRLVFATLGDARADDDMRSVIMRSDPFGPPPRDMPQPLTLRLNLTYPS